MTCFLLWNTKEKKLKIFNCFCPNQFSGVNDDKIYLNSILFWLSTHKLDADYPSIIILAKYANQKVCLNTRNYNLRRLVIIYSAQTLIHKCIIELLVLVFINAKICQAVDRLPSGGHCQLGYWSRTSSDCNSPDCCKMQNHFNDMLKQGSPSLWPLRFPCKIFPRMQWSKVKQNKSSFLWCFPQWSATIIFYRTFTRGFFHASLEDVCFDLISAWLRNTKRLSIVAESVVQSAVALVNIRERSVLLLLTKN